MIITGGGVVGVGCGEVFNYCAFRLSVVKPETNHASQSDESKISQGGKLISK